MNSRNHRVALAGSAVAASLLAGSAQAAPITAGNLVVYRVGDGAQTLANTGNGVFLDEYTRTGTLVQSLNVSAGSAFAASGTATSEGMLTLSPDGQTVAFPGYGIAPGQATSIVSTTATAVPRVIGLLNVSTGSIDTSTRLTDAYAGNNPRSAVVVGNSIYTAGTSNGASNASSGGVRYATIGATTSTGISVGGTTGSTANTANTRTVNVFGGQLYFGASSTPNLGVNALGSGSPTTAGANATNLGVDTASGASPYQFVLLDLSTAIAGPDTLYVADDATNNIQKYTLGSGGAYTASGTIAASGVRGLSGYVDAAGNVDLFAASSTALFSFVDSSGFGNAASGTATQLAVAGTNQAFRGVAALAPTAVAVPEPATAGVAVLAAAVVGRRRRRA